MNVDRTDATALEHVLDEIATAPTPPDAEGLRIWIARYPEYRDAIVEFVTDWTEMELAHPEFTPTDEDVDVVVNRTMSRVQMMLDEAERPPVLTDLAADIRASGHDAISFQRFIGIDQSMLDCLIGRFVSPQTIPASLVGLLATALNRSAEQVRDYLRLSPQLTAAYRSRNRPVLKQTDFDDIVRPSRLTEAEKGRWLAESPDPDLRD